MFHSIVVGLDGSQISDAAMRVACDLAQKYGADLHLVHTPQPQTVAFALGAVAGYHAAVTMPAPQDVQAAADKIIGAAKAIAAQCGQSVASVHTDQGDPADHIIACAKAQNADLIVTGRRGLGAVGTLVQGSTTQRVNHAADCACLSVA